MSEVKLDNWEKRSAEHEKQYKQLLHRVDKKTFLKQLPDLHDEAFSKIDCLQCANCCKNYSPRFKSPDIKRISKYLRMKEGEFIDKYLIQDNEGDYVVKSDNFCSIYEHRPSDCQRFPYTDEDVFFKRPLITLKNATFCPAVYYVLEKIKFTLP
jgi:Fe-S-cluster containining protein